MLTKLSAFVPAVIALLVSGCASSVEEDDAEAGDDALSNGWQPPAAYAEGQLHSDLTSSVIQNLQAIHARNRGSENAFIKVGDSITFSTDFLRCFATTAATGAHADLEPTRSFFTARSWSRQSIASKVGWHTNEPLRGNPAPVDTEINEMRPAYAVVMLGTNDTYAGSEPSYRRNLRALVDHLTEKGIIPILSTIPPRATSSANAIVPRMNAVVRRVAAEASIPLIDLNLALSDLPAYGLSGDGIHPKAARAGACDLSPNGLRSGGYNNRNLLTLQALDRVRHALED